MGTHHVYSTLATDVAYTDYDTDGTNIPVVKRQVVIAGKAGIADKNLITPLGKKTAVSDEDLEFLKGNRVFQMHEKNGHVKVMGKSYDVEKVVADMKTRDNSAPLTPGDYTDGKQPKLNKLTG